MTLRKNILTSWVGHVVIMVLGFFMLPFVLGALGEERYGVWLFINALAGYSSLLYMGFGATVCRYVAKHAHREEWTDLNNVVGAPSSASTARWRASSCSPRPDWRRSRRGSTAGGRSRSAKSSSRSC